MSGIPNSASHFNRKLALQTWGERRRGHLTDTEVPMRDDALCVALWEL